MSENEIIEAAPQDEGNELLAPGNSMNKTLDTIIAEVSERGYHTTFEVETMAGKRKLFKATNAAHLLREYMETPIQAVHMAFSPSEVVTEDGELKTVLAGYIIAEDGEVYMSSSQGVIKSMVRLIDQFGDPNEWTEPVPVVCRETNTNRGRRYKFLDVE